MLMHMLKYWLVSDKFYSFAFSGLDIGISRLKESTKSFNVNFDEKTRYLMGARVSMLPLILCNRNRLGRKTGRLTSYFQI